MTDARQRFWLRGKKTWMIVGGVLVLAVVTYFLVPAAGPDSVDKAVPKPTHTTTKVPVDAGIKVSAGDVATANPCGFLDGPSLTKLGEVDGEPSAVGLVGCSADIEVVGDVDLDLNSGFETAEGPDDPKTHKQDGITVYQYATTDEDVCWRELAAAENAVVSLTASSYKDGTTDCELSDIAITAVIEVLKAGNLPAWDLPAESLARQQACGLVKLFDANRVPGIDMTRMHWEYREQYCTWGKEDDNEAYLIVNFGVSEEGPPSTSGPHRWISADFGDYSGHMAQLQEDENAWRGCVAVVFYRPLDYSDIMGDTETLEVTIHADQPAKKTCNLVKDIAAAAASQLKKILEQKRSAASVPQCLVVVLRIKVAATGRVFVKVSQNG